ncbi:DsbA family protein [Lacipirellula parvula]|uniref:Thioredoxin domain-containing protein n=1 Tax=Lacipirellula parvula TaxID=2650471 RepID=A0A5K7X295_9BACT|nr:thioredoxin domain-containing protein [Lacipirellula parvula]BBO30768.1 hypothetical protein PLANPX_0380 [Lacipirellula parvula]
MKTADAAQLTLPVSARDHQFGDRRAAVTIVEYGDYECPYCARAHLVVKDLADRLGDAWNFVFRNFPLTTIHPHAQHAAEAAEAAGAQGLFWEMHDYLFLHQDSLSDRDLVRDASLLGVEEQQFVDDLRDHKFADRVREDFLSGARSGVNGTPTFFINGVRYDGPIESGSILAAIELASASG